MDKGFDIRVGGFATVKRASPIIIYHYNPKQQASGLPIQYNGYLSKGSLLGFGAINYHHVFNNSVVIRGGLAVELVGSQLIRPDTGSYEVLIRKTISNEYKAMAGVGYKIGAFDVNIGYKLDLIRSYRDIHKYDDGTINRSGRTVRWNRGKMPFFEMQYKISRLGILAGFNMSKRMDQYYLGLSYKISRGDKSGKELLRRTYFRLGSRIRS